MTGEIFNAGNLGELQQAHTYEEADEAKENFESTCVVSDILATIQDTREKIPIAEEPPSLVNRTPIQASLRGTRNNHPWLCPASEKSQRTVNPIRTIVDPIIKNIETGEQREDGKDLISLALGDPTVGGNLPPCIQAIEGVIGNVKTPPHRAGYVNACGDSQARKAIVRHHSYPQHQLNADNVIVANGCSGALELALMTLLDPGTLLLVPQPGFPLYQVIAKSHGATTLPYRLDPDRCWEIDLGHLENLLLKYRPGLVRAIVVNNPSNPSGAVFSFQHLQDSVELCRRFHLLIVADEVYGNLVFGQNTFHPIAQVAAMTGRTVPVITASGISKEYLLPGWRVGWICFHDNNEGSLAQIQEGATRLAQVILGASNLAQSIIPTLLDSDDEDLKHWKQNLKAHQLEEQARVLCDPLSKIRGLQVITPQGSMCAMVKVAMKDFDLLDDLDFLTMLLHEENVFVLPGSAFGAPHMIRVVFCSHNSMLEEAVGRISAFCQRHWINKERNVENHL